MLLIELIFLIKSKLLIFNLNKMDRNDKNWLYYLLITLRNKRDYIDDDVCFHDALITIYKKRFLDLA